MIETRKMHGNGAFNERMMTLLDRLNTAQHSVTGSPPTRVSFSKIAEWCNRAVGVQLNEVYHDLLQSYLSGAFERTVVFYLTNVAPDLTGETGLAGYRMRRNFLEARTRAFSPDNPKESPVLFEAYLAPCWIHRKAAVRWLESRAYPVPTWWARLDGPLEAQPTAQPNKKQNKRGPKPKYLPDDIRNAVFESMDYNGDFDPSDPNWCREADLEQALTGRFGMAIDGKEVIKRAACRVAQSQNARPIIKYRPLSALSADNSTALR